MRSAADLLLIHQNELHIFGNRFSNFFRDSLQGKLLLLLFGVSFLIQFQFGRSWRTKYRKQDAPTNCFYLRISEAAEFLRTPKTPVSLKLIATKIYLARFVFGSTYNNGFVSSCNRITQ